MFLEDKHADLYLKTGESREIWWITGNEFTVMSDCPDNYPRTVLHTMSWKDGIVEYRKLLSEGWEEKRSSPEFQSMVAWTN